MKRGSKPAPRGGLSGSVVASLTTLSSERAVPQSRDARGDEALAARINSADPDEERALRRDLLSARDDLSDELIELTHAAEATMPATRRREWLTSSVSAWLRWPFIRASR